MQKIMLSLLMLVTLSAISLNAWSKGVIYKCKNDEGATVYKKSPCTEEGQTVSKWEEPDREHKEMSIRQGKNGHYFLEGEINGKTLTFVVDTGASGLALPGSIARAAKIECKSNSLVASTANGPASGCTVTVPTLKFGPFQLKDVKAMVLPNLTQPLLGMNVLEQFNIEQGHGEMRISEH